MSRVTATILRMARALISDDKENYFSNQRKLLLYIFVLVPQNKMEPAYGKLVVIAFA